jgi:co-chaperonin GroES (HSP10)
MKPIKDKVIVKVNLSERISSGGIHIPGSAKSIVRNRGTVISVGPGEWLTGAGRYRPLDVAPGDTVMVNHLAGVWVDQEKTLLLIRECDIDAILEPDSNIMVDNKYDVDPRDVA